MGRDSGEGTNIANSSKENDQIDFRPRPDIYSKKQHRFIVNFSSGRRWRRKDGRGRNFGIMGTMEAENYKGGFTNYRQDWHSRLGRRAKTKIVEVGRPCCKKNGREMDQTSRILGSEQQPNTGTSKEALGRCVAGVLFVSTQQSELDAIRSRQRTLERCRVRLCQLLQAIIRMLGGGRLWLQRL